jgi:hypothetical protein
VSPPLSTLLAHPSAGRDQLTRGSTPPSAEQQEHTVTHSAVSCAFFESHHAGRGCPIKENAERIRTDTDTQSLGCQLRQRGCNSRSRRSSEFRLDDFRNYLISAA